MKYAVLLLVVLAGLAPLSGRGGQIGEPAAPLLVTEWIKGQPVEVKPGTNIIVLEIFTTSSLASRASITNLNALQKRFKGQGVVVVGVSDEPVNLIKDSQDGKYLLCQRAIPPRPGTWTLPAGFMESGETTEQAALREVWEESGVRAEIISPYSIFSVPTISGMMTPTIHQ